MTDKKETEKKGMAAADRLRWLPPAVKNIIITAVSAAVLCFCAFAVIRYGSSDGSDSSDSLRRPDESEHFAVDTTAASDTTPSGLDPGTEDELPITARPAAELAAEGYVLSEGAYDDSYRIGEIDCGIDFGEEYSLRSLRSDNGGGGYTSVPVLRMYMGYILYDNGSYLSALTGDGAVAAAGIDKLTPIYQRTGAGKPVFSSGKRYYIINDGEGTLSEIRFDPDFGTTLSYDYPASYVSRPVKLYRFYVDTEEIRLISDWTGKDLTDDIARTLEIHDEDYLSRMDFDPYTKQVVRTRLWGYEDGAGNVVIEPTYHYATEFNADGYAFVGGSDGRLQMIDGSGDVVLDTYPRTFYLASGDARYVIDGMYMPEKRDASCIGMFRFDHGLMRVSRQIYDYYNPDEHASTLDSLIYQDGKVFALPTGYTLCSYSDGVALLQHGAEYGYMDYTGRWIVEPTLRSAEPFYEGLAVIGYGSGEKVVIDTSGKVVLRDGYSYISNCSSGVMVAYSVNTGWHVFNKMAQAAQ